MRLILGVAATLVVAATPAFAQPEGLVIQAEQHFPGSYIVQTKPGSSASALSIQYGGTLHAEYRVSYSGFNVRGLSEAGARRLAADPRVQAVYEDGMARIADTQNNPPSWGQDRVDQKALPLDSKYTYANKGEAVTAYVIDTGINPNNPEWEGRASYGYDFVDNDSEAQDCHGHGSHVAGTIAGKTYGLAKKAKIVAVRALGCGGTAPDSAAVSAMEWIAKNAKKPAVVNMSLGMDNVGVGDAQAKALVQDGITVAVAAGNSSADACNTSPARVPEVITVGSTERNDGRSSFSNYGSCLDIFAPGGNIVSTGINSGSATMSGTSMASPHVAGAAALYLTANQSATPQQVRDALVNNASGGVGNPGNGSPNKLLYTGFIGGGQNPGSFALALSPSQGQTDAGKPVSTTVTTKAGEQGAETVSLTATGLPTGAKATFQPSEIQSGQNAKLTIETSASTPAGQHRITVSGKGIIETKTADFTLSVGGPPTGDLTLAVSPGSGTARPGGFLTATVSATGGTGTITLDATGVQFKPFFNPQTVSPGGSSQITIIAPFQTGTYKITITGTDSSGKTGSTEYSLSVQ
ncbi:S8 family peptidase [Kibdelosporangium philippinense]|uniref:S8 family peptidase n=1 Tax=Kibdelosporangium philippinense TaxID=211113 RepID=A0ABS8ZKA4_9PSEU|nr:S8 family peptidase [Kibdelosporangium philippinense]MCE7006222.1 S8 family peptidase [Kibdelosporangium philippinense]